ncbi:MAG: GNAT family N-acetyltransferase [Burkholderiales bacterium]|nr:GNAT family N-acetyltransferase [Burkholderiales bacterium]
MAGALDIQVLPVSALGDHIAIPSVFESSVIYDPVPAAAERVLVEQALAAPMRKDYDALESPWQWLAFDVSKWALIVACAEGQRVGGVICAIDTPGVEMLEGRSDLVVIWDIRVAAGMQQAGVGSALFRAAEAWARTRSCRELKVETQNVNVPACRLYRRNGCTLAEANAGAYPELPAEVQLIWRKRLDQ